MRNITLSFGIVLAVGLSALVSAETPKAKDAEKQAASGAASHHKIVAASDLVWTDAPPGLPPGGKMALLDGDPTKPGLFTVRLQSPDGYKIMPHTHPTAELVTVISGTVHLGAGGKFDEAAAKEMTAGGFAVLPAGMQHFAWMTGDSVIQIHGQGPFKIKYVNPEDDPRNAKK